MRKFLSSFFLLCIFFNFIYGQIPVPQIKKSSVILSGLSKNANPQVPPTRTCGTMEADSALRANNPSLGTLQDFENWLQKKIAQDSAAGIKMPPVYTIPVIVHIIHNGESVGSGSNISQAQVNSQIDVLNEDFRKTNADASSIPSVFQLVSADIEIQFCAAVVDPSGNSLTQPGIDRVNRNSKGFSAPPYSTSYIDGTIKPNTYWDPTKYFNIWVLNLGNSLLGYAQFPSNSGLSGLNANGGAANTDGIVILYTAFGRVGNVSAPYNKGRTATHEAGHWFGLRHIWGDGNCATDYCSDTPPHEGSHSGCPTHPYHTNQCGSGTSPNGEMFMNYMDYTNDACMYMFTANQRTRMRTVMQNSPRRVELTTSTVCNTNAPPSCGFTASSFTITEGGSINYTDQSSGNPTGWSWTFQGGTPSSSTQQNPNGIVYNTVGTYNTTLIVTNAFGTCTLTQVIIVIANVGCDTLNYPPLGTIVLYKGGNGFVCGWNTTYEDISKAEYFSSYSPYTHVTGGLVYFGRAYRSSGSNATVLFRVWNNTGTGGSPGTILASKTITLQSLASVVPNGGLYQIIFDSPVQVTTPFYFGLTMQNFTNNDSLGVRSNTNGDSNPNTAWEQWSDNAWYPFNDANSWNISISQYMSPFMTNLPPNAILTASDTNECAGATLTFNGSNSTYENSYSWSFTGGTPSTSTSASQSVTYNTAGTYKAVLTVGGTCQGSDKDSIVNIAINANPAVNANATDVSCNGATNGTATATPSGGNSPYSYSWSNGQTNATATGLVAGTYTVTITDDNGCNANASVGVAQPSALTVSTSSTNTGCGGTNGTATAVPSGGNSPYNFLWNNGQTSATASGLAAGTYTVTVSDNSGCTKTATASVSSSGGGLSATTSVNNVTCNGGSNGSATANPNGGTTPYNYNWNTSPSQTTQTATGLSAGNYSVTINDVNNCSVVQSITVAEPSALTVTNSQTNGTCGNANGSATVNASGGTNSFSYLWSNGQTNSTATGLSAGNYTVTISDANNCSATSNFSIANTAAPTITTSVNNISCNGNNNGSATANTSGGTSPFNYNWSDGATTPSINNLSPGTYNVTVTDANNCTSTSSAAITQPTTLNSSANASSASCNGVCDGAVSALASGGTSPYNYNWSGSLGNGESKSNVCAGNYSVTITDANNCTSVTSATVNEPPIIILTTSSVKATCGNPNGTATVSASGGASGFTYLWNNGQTDSTATGLISGTYTVTVTDAASCTNTANVNVSNDIPTSLSISSNNVSCNGGNNGSATATPVGGTLPYSFSWSNGATSATINSLAAGTYTATVTDANNCAAIQSVNITQPAAFATNPSSTNVSCNGGNNGTATVNVSGGTSPYSYNWSNGAATSSVSNLSASNYIVTVTDANNCTGTQSFTITEPSALNAASSSIAATCSGTCNGTLSASGNGGTSPYTFNWSGGLGSGSNISDVCAGTYTVTVTDANGCTKTSSATVTQPSAINISTSSSNATCGVSNGSAAVNASGGAGGFSYLWNNGSTNSSINNLSAGTYSVTITDASNCTKTASITVTNPGAPTVTTTSTDVTCNGGNDGSATANVNGGNTPYSYLWSNGATTSSVSGLPSSVYSVTVTDASSCAASSSVTIAEPSAISAATLVNYGCSISASVTASGGTSGYSYLWNTGEQTQNIMSLQTGTYTVTVTDANNCILTATADVTNDPANITAAGNVTNVSCNGGNDGAISIAASGGASPYSYLWNNGENQSAIGNLQAATYTVTVTDNNSCTGTSSFTVSEPSVLSSSATSTNVLCNGGNDGTAAAAVGGGVSPYFYEWSNGDTASSVFGLPSSVYSVTITDNNGCSSTTSANVSEPQELILTSSSTAETCGQNNGTATVIVNGGVSPYSFQWSNGDTTQTITGLNGEGSVNYGVLVVDANNCFTNKNVNVQGASAVSGSVSTGNANCNASDGSATVNASGGTPPYSYLWNNGATQSSIGNLQSAVYSVTVTDNAGCTFTASDSVESNAGISITASSWGAVCGGNNGAAAVDSVNGGISPYIYLWSNGDSLPTADSLYSGNYIVIVTDINGCSDSATVVVEGANTMSVNPVISNENCGKGDGVVIANVSGGTSPYAYSWSDSKAQTTQVATGLSQGTYNISITDANNCIKIDSITIINTSNLIINLLQAAGGHCGSSNGTVASSASGGPFPYSYLWSNGDTTVNADTLTAGNYSLTITDAAGCKAVGTVTVGSTPLSVADSVIDETCDGKNDGSASLAVSGGASPYSYLWSTDANSKDLSNAKAGEYFLTITDVNGCTLKDTITIGLKEADGCLNIPTGFTPNGDGKNDTWKIRGIGNYPDIMVEIFNRWGSIVFNQKGYAQPWDGTNNGKELPAAAYFYVITLGNGETRTGSVTIIR